MFLFIGLVWKSFINFKHQENRFAIIIHLNFMHEYVDQNSIDIWEFVLRIATL